MRELVKHMSERREFEVARTKKTFETVLWWECLRIAKRTAYLEGDEQGGELYELISLSLSFLHCKMGNIYF